VPISRHETPCSITYIESPWVVYIVTIYNARIRVMRRWIITRSPLIGDVLRHIECCLYYTHTHTHTYSHIYIYIYIYLPRLSAVPTCAHKSFYDYSEMCQSCFLVYIKRVVRRLLANWRSSSLHFTAWWVGRVIVSIQYYIRRICISYSYQRFVF